MTGWTAWGALALALPLGCGDKEPAEGGETEMVVVDDDGVADDATTVSDGGSSEDESTSDSGSACPPGGCLDTPGCAGENCACPAPPHVPCDDGAQDLLQAMGVGCPREPEVEIDSWGSPLAFGTMKRFGNSNVFRPQEGERFVVLGSGRVDEIAATGSTAGCSSDLGSFDPGVNLPAPIVPTDVGMETCEEDAALVGTGDCSNTIQEQFEDSFSSFTPGAHDYTELRFDITVPAGASSFSYDFAFFTYEYPGFYGSQYNDMYIGWLESSQWTGNISFDENGRPISVNASFMDFLDSDTSNQLDGMDHPTCATGAGCTASELHDTCMMGHGGTRWLTTTAGVTEGEDITIVFAVMDLGDSVLDSYVFLDNFVWGCEDGPPITD
jgi:hypothetical protein